MTFIMLPLLPDSTIDPWGGSYFMESLTEEVYREAQRQAVAFGRRSVGGEADEGA